ncbi:RICIN domain-containing protein [Streptomyces sp. NPDC006326]|uniref:RICIN domain-containing protein n=1 Tax=Streptomyces sp. NPDC006326 TaxID=3156752 RepID=UPI0033ACDE6A
MTSTAWTRRVMLSAAVGALAAGGTMVPSSAFAADCDQFPGGICPLFSDGQKPPEFGDLWWNIRSARTGDLVAEENVGGFRVQPRSDRKTQLFRFLKSSDADSSHGPVYQIQVHPGTPSPDGSPMCLEAGETNGAVVQANPCEETASQFWEIEPHPKGFSRIRQGTGAMRCLDIRNPTALNPPPSGAALQEWTCHAADNQAWTFVLPVSQPKAWDPMVDGIYYEYTPPSP